MNISYLKKPLLVFAFVAAIAVPITLGQLAAKAVAQQATTQLPAYPLRFGVFVARFEPGGTFTLKGDHWPELSGNWKMNGAEIAFLLSGGPGGCDGTGRS
ncbi:MAG: hypothetical protein ACREBG_16200 [Pyrinomonadaceae bacterium]